MNMTDPNGWTNLAVEGVTEPGTPQPSQSHNGTSSSNTVKPSRPIIYTSATLGRALEGECAFIEGEEGFPTQSPRAEGVEAGEPDEQLEGVEESDPDRIRASLLRRGKRRMERKQKAAAAEILPFIPPHAQPAALAAAHPADPGSRKKRTKRHRLRPERTTWQQFVLCCRVCLHWRVFKHVLAMLVLPCLCIAGLLLYWRLGLIYQPFAESLLSAGLSSVRWHLDYGGASASDVFMQDGRGRAPIHLAAASNSTDMVRLILQSGAEVGAADKAGMTALHYASHNQNAEMVDVLLAAGAPVDVRDERGRTALHLAAIQGSLPVLASLVFTGHASLRLADIDGYLAVDYSRLFHSSSFQRLLDEGWYPDPHEPGGMRVIPHKQFRAMQLREEVPAAAIQDQVERKERDGKRKRRRKKKAQERTSKARSEKTEPARAPASSASPPSAADDDEDDESIMALFTGSDDGGVAAARYHRSKADVEAALQRRVEAEAELSDMRETWTSG